MVQSLVNCKTETKPLAGRCIVVTRPRPQAHNFVVLLENYGAEVFLFPTIETVPMTSYAQLDAALDRLTSYSWLIFTSVNGVRYFVDRLQARQIALTSLAHLKIATIGPETARAVERLPLQVAVIPEEYRAEAIIPLLGDIARKRILLPRAAEARKVLPEELRDRGAVVDEIVVYKTVQPQHIVTNTLRMRLQKGQIDMVTFTSSSTVRNFMQLFMHEELAPLLARTTIGCIGPITAETVRAYGFSVVVQSSVYTIPAFTGAIVEYFSRQTR